MTAIVSQASQKPGTINSVVRRQSYGRIGNSGNWWLESHDPALKGDLVRYKENHIFSRINTLEEQYHVFNVLT